MGGEVSRTASASMLLKTPINANLAFMSPHKKLFEISRLAEFCKRNNIKKLFLFGSALRDDFRLESDVDVLVEFEEMHTPGFIGLARMERELSSLLGQHKADLRTARDLSRYFREEVMRTAELVYAQE
jgi:predicted nucleotidyltransferase